MTISRRPQCEGCNVNIPKRRLLTEGSWRLYQPSTIIGKGSYDLPHRAPSSYKSQHRVDRYSLDSYIKFLHICRFSLKHYFAI